MALFDLNVSKIRLPNGCCKLL